MKRFLIALFAIVLINTVSRAQYVAIPDPVLQTYFMDNYPSCMNGSNMLDTTCAAVINQTDIYISMNVSNWEGFQYLKNLRNITLNGQNTSLPTFPATTRNLYISSSQLTTISSLPAGLTDLTIESMLYLNSISSLPGTLTHININMAWVLPTLPALPATLTYLKCTNCFRLTSFPSFPNALDTLNCTIDSLLTMPALPSSLKYLDCSYNQLASMPSLPASLKYIDCNNNSLITTFPALPGQLEYCNVRGLSLTDLPALPAGLTYLDCSANPLGSLPSLPASLQTLLCNGDQLNVIPALPGGLLSFSCASNLIVNLPSLPAGLTDFSCSRNQISALPALPASLQGIDCSYNQLTTLPVLPAGLISLECSNNSLISLPNLPVPVTNIRCSNNQLTSIPPLPSGLIEIYCNNNQLYFLPDLPATLHWLVCEQNPIRCMPVIPSGINITVNNTISCIPNLPAMYFLTLYDSITGFSAGSYNEYSNYQVCSAVNNEYHCSAFPLMAGYVFNDNNNNGIRDANEPTRPNIKVELSNGVFTLTDNNGHYQLLADNTGSYTTTIVTPIYFTSVPMQYNYSFNSFDTMVTKDFALQATATRDSLAISINPINTAARPGFPYPYQITYSNDGTTTLNATIVFNYDNTRLIYDSSSNASVVNTGSSLTLSEPGFVSGMQKSFIGYFIVNPSVVIGDSLRAGAHITGGSAAAHDSDVVAIRGAFDPNDKSATPNLTPAQVLAGDYIYYSIRFQNTGTDTAFNIVVTDTLDSKLQASTFQMISTSHPCITTVKDNKISFEFINILLPDSNVNQFKSHGYISFRIKPLSTLVLNDVVPNKAAIYFDYNSPVITNLATTTIANPVVVPLKLLSFTASRGIGLTANLYWQTSNEVNVRNYTIEMSTNGRTFTAVGTENARGYQYNSYTKIISVPSVAVLYLRLKMTDIDGHSSYSNVAILKNDQPNNSFSFLKNPAKDELSISLPDESLRNTTATIYTSQGIKVKTILLQHDVENINVKSLPAGTYYLVTGKGSRQFVIIK